MLTGLVSVTLFVTPIAPAAAAPWGCQFSTPSLGWKPALTNSAAYLNPAQWSARYWHETNTPIFLTQVSSGANIVIADGTFAAADGFDGIVKTATGDDRPCLTPHNWTTGMVAWWNKRYTDSYSGEKKLSVMVHELGHTLGLWHEDFTSCNYVSIMEDDTYTRYDVCRKYTPQTADVAFINQIY